MHVDPEHEAGWYALNDLHSFLQFIVHIPPHLLPPLEPLLPPSPIMSPGYGSSISHEVSKRGIAANAIAGSTMPAARRKKRRRDIISSCSFFFILFFSIIVSSLS